MAQVMHYYYNNLLLYTVTFHMYHAYIADAVLTFIRINKAPIIDTSNLCFTSSLK